MNVQSYVTQRLRTTILQSLDSGLESTAEFTAERLIASTEKGNSDSIHLYGLVLYRRQKYKSAYRVVANNQHVGCIHIFALCALKLGLYKDGIEALQQTIDSWNVNNDLLENNVLENKENTRQLTPGPAVMFCLLGKLFNNLGDVKESIIHHTQALKLDPYLWESFEELCQLGANINTKLIFKPELSQISSINNNKSNNSTSISGVTLTTSTNANNGSSIKRTSMTPMNPKLFFNKQDDSIGNTSNDAIDNSITTNNIFSTPRIKNSQIPDAPLRKFENSKTKISSRLTTPTASNNNNTNNNITNNNNNNTSNFNFGKRDNKRNTKSVINTFNNPLDVRKKEYHDQAEFQLMTLYLIFAKGLKAMSRFDCYKSIRIFNQLPNSQIETPWVLSKLGKLNFEVVRYDQAEIYFKKLRKLDRTRIEDMEIYSTLLWHLQKDSELSYLAHELYEINKNCPETWVTIGNLFSLQRETEESIKCFQRAIQIDYKFAYAYTLQGHEYESNDAYENALESFRNALLYDSKHYNALYGIGMVYLKLGEFKKAEFHFRKASNINPVNVILICCVGMVLEKLEKKELALKQYELATELQPNSPLALFKKAQLLYSLQYISASLSEFEKLKSIAPDEPGVHFLLGQLYKIVGRKSEAIKEFTIALNLDPKGSHLVKDFLENLNE